MFLSMKKIREMVDDFLNLSSITPTRLQITLSGTDDRGEPVSVTARYDLAGMYPEREISGIGASELPLCPVCEKNRVEEGMSLCQKCRAETWNDDEAYDDWGDSEDE